MHVYRSLSVWNVYGIWGYMCTFLHGKDVCVHVWDAHICVSLTCLFVESTHVSACTVWLWRIQGLTDGSTACSFCTSY